MTDFEGEMVGSPPYEEGLVGVEKPEEVVFPDWSQAELSPRQDEALRLYHTCIDGEVPTYSQVAEIMDVKPAVVKRHLELARYKLKNNCSDVLLWLDARRVESIDAQKIMKRHVREAMTSK